MRDDKGRFTKGNPFAAEGGRARAKKLSPRRRRAIARKGRRAMVLKHFAGDDRAQRAYFAALGRYNYERMTAIPATWSTLGASVARAARHPGTPNEFLAVFWQLPLFPYTLAGLPVGDVFFG